MVAESIAFLRSNEAEMSRLSRYPGLESVFLDFGVSWHPDSAAQFSRIPPELLRLAGQYGFWLELSHYLTEPSGSAEVQ